DGELEADEPAAPKKKSKKTEVDPAATALFSVEFFSGRVELQENGSPDWKQLAAGERPAFKNGDILKAAENAYILFRAPGQCALRLDQASTLMLDGIAKNPPSATLVKGTLLLRCLSGQPFTVKTPLFRLDNKGGAAGISYEYDTGIAAAARYEIAASAAKGKTVKPVRSEPAAVSITLNNRTTSLQLKEKQQVIVSKQTIDPQPGDIQPFFSDFTVNVSALSIPPAEKIVVKRKKKTPAEKEEKTAPKLSVNRFESKREQERSQSERSSKSSFKNKFKKQSEQ
ncbi:MAG TPA: hypothetical protein PLL10_03790, partial [Elusimicrobiales bacterium]|nr:hypothetical protein [Elusimicrobiales bacterium]